MWKITWVNLMMLMASIPDYYDEKEAEQDKELETEEELREFLKL